MYRALASGQVDVIAGDATSGLIKALDLAMLADDRGYFPPYHAVPIVRSAVLLGRPEIGDALAALAGRIPEESMRAMNYAVDGQAATVQGSSRASADRPIRTLLQLCDVITCLPSADRAAGDARPWLRTRLLERRARKSLN